MCEIKRLHFQQEGFSNSVNRKDSANRKQSDHCFEIPCISRDRISPGVLSSGLPGLRLSSPQSHGLFTAQQRLWGLRGERHLPPKMFVSADTGLGGGGLQGRPPRITTPLQRAETRPPAENGCGEGAMDPYPPWDLQAFPQTGLGPLPHWGPRWTRQPDLDSYFGVLFPCNPPTTTVSTPRMF